MAKQGFPRRYRIVRSSDYGAIYRESERLQGQHFVLYLRANGLGHHRLGITVSRKVGKAVVRNRIKRLFREIFRRTCVEIPHYFDFVVNARPACAGAGYERLREEFLSLVRRRCR